MRYAVRFGIIFIMALFAARVSPGILIGEHWYFFFWCLFVAALNAFIRNVIVGTNTKVTWLKVIISAAILNFILYSLVAMGATTWLTLSVTTFGAAMLGALVVTITSAICNHFIGIRAS